MHSLFSSHSLTMEWLLPQFYRWGSSQGRKCVVILIKCVSGDSQTSSLFFYTFKVDFLFFFFFIFLINSFSINQINNTVDLGVGWEMEGWWFFLFYVLYYSDRYAPSLHELGHFNIPTLCDLANLQWFILTKAQQARENMKRKEEWVLLALFLSYHSV